MQKAVALIALVCLLMTLPAGRAVADDARVSKHVVELFTSQACNSCPPADAYLAELASDPDILALSWNVDYWDYLGWKDSFAKPSHTERQRAYNRRMGRRDVYTPQLVVNGMEQAVGSRRNRVQNLLTEKTQPLPVSPVVISTRDGHQLSLPATEGVKDAHVYVVFYEPSATVPIHAGENSGKTITYTNVVKDIRDVGQWNGEATTMALPSMDAGGNVCAVLIQAPGHGPILAAVGLPM